MIQFHAATTEDLEEIIELLAENVLPSSDVHKHINHFFIAKKGDKVIGSIGLEVYNNHGLLRSLAVSKEYRNLNIGKELYSTLLSYSRKNRINTLHLLTTTAETYFKKLDFTLTDRNLAPESIKKTAEFSELCPSSSTYMVKNI